VLSELIQRIASLQSKGTKTCPYGLFLSIRENRAFLYARQDNNVFASLSIAYILKTINPYLLPDEKAMVNGILEDVRSLLWQYQNKEGLKTYNFWLTKPSQHFPNGYLMKRFKYFKLPDDIDDTSLVFLIKEYNEEGILWLKNKLQKHTNSKVYSTWFGENMPIEQDVCALCNLMVLISDSASELNEYDRATLQYLNEIMVSGEFLRNPFWVARHYGTVPLIIYHYARLLQVNEILELKEARECLLKLIPDLFMKEKIWMNKVLLQTSFLKIAQSSEKQSVLKWNAMGGDWEEEWKSQHFYPFIGAPFAPLSLGFLKGLASKIFFQIGWKCEAHELTLLLENVILRNNFRH